MKLFKIFFWENVTVSTITGGLSKSDNTLKYCSMICTVYQIALKCHIKQYRLLVKLAIERKQ